MTDRFGIAEWFGVTVDTASAAEKVKLHAAATSGASPLPLNCPFSHEEGTPCSKTTGPGVCSVRLFGRGENGKVRRAASPEGDLRATCDRRIRAHGEIYRWVSEIILNDSQAMVLPEISFMRSTVTGRAAGKIDNVLVTQKHGAFDWCALEIQAVYVQGSKYLREFEAVRNSGPDVPWPTSGFRPDYRSSGAKRLAPQLGLKVPTLRRWGKKMAVAVDEGFFRHMGGMVTVDAVEDCDVAWFVVAFEDLPGGPSRLVRKDVHFTTLDVTLGGLVAAEVVTRGEFEGVLRERTATALESVNR